MKSDELLDAIGEARDEYVHDVRNGKNKKAANWVKWTSAIAACLVLIAGIALHQQPTELPELPMLTLSESADAMGFEGYLAYHVSELVNANPWTNRSNLSALPVYRNPQTYNGAGEMISGDTSEIENLRDEVACKIPDAQVIVEDGMTVQIEYAPAVRLPEAYPFGDDSSYDELESVADYLLAEYGDLIGMQKPTANIYGGDYDIYGNQQYHLSFYDSAGDLTDQIVQYNFNSVTFYPDHEGNLWLIRLKRPDLSEKMGDYPIISVKEAEELLRSGKYTTSVPYAFTDDRKISKVELMYRTSLMDQYFIPYYRFYVELPEEEYNGMNLYGAYYVPAVMEPYIENMPLWDGSFD